MSVLPTPFWALSSQPSEFSNDALTPIEVFSDSSLVITPKPTATSAAGPTPNDVSTLRSKPVSRLDA